MSHVHLSTALILALFAAGPAYSQEPVDADQPQTAVVPFQQGHQLPVTIHPAPGMPRINVYRQPPVVSIEGAQPTPACCPPQQYVAPQVAYPPGASVVVQNTPPIPTEDAYTAYMKHKLLFHARFRKGLLPRRYVQRRDALERTIHVMQFFHNYQITPRQ